MVLGNGSERQSALDTVRSFDVDWMRGQSVGIYPVSNSAPEPLVAELEKIMDSGESGLSHNLVKFQVITRQNAILVVATKPDLLRTAASWISRLDSPNSAASAVHVYKVRFGEAKQIAQLLNEIFVGGSNGGGLDTASNEVAPTSGAAPLTATERLTGGRAANPSPLGSGLGANAGAQNSAAAAGGIPAANPTTPAPTS